MESVLIVKSLKEGKTQTGRPFLSVFFGQKLEGLVSTKAPVHRNIFGKGKGFDGTERAGSPLFQEYLAGEFGVGSKLLGSIENVKTEPFTGINGKPYSSVTVPVFDGEDKNNVALSQLQGKAGVILEDGKIKRDQRDNTTVAQAPKATAQAAEVKENAEVDVLPQ